MCKTIRKIGSIFCFIKGKRIMKLLKTDQGVVANVYVRPDSREFKIEVEDEELRVYCKESPIKGKVNRELLKELSRLFKRKIEIVGGFTSKQKKILIANISIEEVNKILSNYKS
jgi:uncharacterized protein (TIGR00251 family)